MSADDQQTNIDDLLLENRKFPPSAAFKKNSLAVGTHLYDQAAADDEGFWAQQAADLIDWDQDWHTICEWNVPYAKWFVGGKLNVSYNCLDRHVLAGKGDKVAMWYLSGNRDDSVIEHPDRFIIDRARPRQHLSFGFGIHRCVGNRLAELQLKILWEELLPRFPVIEVVGEPQRTVSNFVRGFTHLPVRLPR